MPIFEYKCNDCEKVFEILQLPGRNREKRCACGSANLTKLISAPFLPSSVGKPANDTSCAGCDGAAANACPGANACGAPGACCGNPVP
ncbi:MAG: zinc ribbon domain-containing protein [Firmicutes bacterium]|nr:zinc ribbon domain-containing protein [Bacillota bacterium]